jgi:excisionase family DNA binding protein
LENVEHAIMTIEQVAKYLQISEVSTYKLVNEGRIPAFKIGRHWRIRKIDLEEALEKVQRGERL